MHLTFQSLISSLLRFLQLSFKQFKSFIGFGVILGVPSPKRTSKFGQINCLTNVFLHYEFQLSMFSSLKISFWECVLGEPFQWGFLLPLSLIRIIVWQTNSYSVSFIFLCSAVQKFNLEGYSGWFLPLKDP